MSNVCRGCARWNLSPVEERWEAIEAADRVFTDSRVRPATEHLGLVKLPEGLDLIRVGNAPRLELTGWRYGSHIRRRRIQQYALAAGLAAGMGVMAVTGAYGPLLAIPGGAATLHVPSLIHAARRRYGVIARLDIGDGERAAIDERLGRFRGGAGESHQRDSGS